jgi:hypothetical protein
MFFFRNPKILEKNQGITVFSSRIQDLLCSIDTYSLITVEYQENLLKTMTYTTFPESLWGATGVQSEIL